MPGMTVGHWHGDYGGLRLADVGKGYLGLNRPPAYLTAVAIQSLGGRGNELGTIRPGYVADLLVVDGDPGNDIAILRHTDGLKMIVKQGQIVKNELGPLAS
jgi:cytosine/adenosine deaminase-related metal-dependent hydrolase